MDSTAEFRPCVDEVRVRHAIADMVLRANAKADTSRFKVSHLQQ
jgi:hypothetical protein